MHTYRVVIEHDRDNGTYWGRQPALPRCFTQGESVAEVLENLQEAMGLYLDGLKQDGLPVPPGDATEDQPLNLTITVAA